MCSNIDFCVLLGPYPQHWDKHAPLVAPAWFRDSLAQFVEAGVAAAAGREADSLAHLEQTGSDELRAFFLEHAHVSGYRRARILGLPEPAADEEADSGYLAKWEAELFARDAYTCRYCGTPVIPGQVFDCYSAVVGAAAFPLGPKTDQRHGVIFAFRAVLDHVVPHYLGGRTEPDNLVTACWPCNFGKRKFTVDQLGLEDPRTRPPTLVVGWHGLAEHLPGLREHASSRPPEPGMIHSLVSEGGAHATGTLLETQPAYFVIRAPSGRVQYLRRDRWRDSNDPRMA